MTIVIVIGVLSLVVGIISIFFDSEDVAILIGFGLFMLLVVAPLINWMNDYNERREQAVEAQLEEDYPSVDVVNISLENSNMFAWEVDGKLCRASLRKFDGRYVLPEYPSCSVLPE